MPKKLRHNELVTHFLNDLNHPRREEIELLRALILQANSLLNENVKWNAPNFFIAENEDRITLKILPLGSKIQLIFHRGAKKQAQPSHKLVKTTNKIIVWKENDRAVLTFNSSEDILDNKTFLEEFINQWLEACTI